MLTHSRPPQVAPAALRTVPAPRRSRISRVVAAAAACTAVGAATVVIADDQLAPQAPAIAEPSRPLTAGYFDTDANKAASMRALRVYIAEQPATPGTRYHDSEANKARSQRAR